MATMEEAEDLARRLDARLAAIGDIQYMKDVLNSFNDSLYDFRADGDLEAHVERAKALLDEATTKPAAAKSPPPDEMGPTLRSWRSMFSSG